MCDFVNQQELLNFKEKVIICNFKRCAGKTDFIIDNIKKSPLKRHYVMCTTNIKYSYLRGIDSSNCKKHKSETTVDLSNGSSVVLRKFTRVKDIVTCKIDIIYFDECFPSSEEISVLLSNGVKKIYCLFTNDNIRLVDKNSDSEKDFYINSINKLKYEYESLENNKNTVMTRENILKQIQLLLDLKNTEIKYKI